jgi:putative transposase
MARLARVIAPGYPHHVTHRGNHRDDIFLEDGDREKYYQFLAGCAAKAKLEIWAYCLMTNHVHLIVVPRRYAVWLNRREGWSGHLWANRYFSTPLDESHHWSAVRYVERNPVRARLVGQAAQYRWSSAPAHVLGAPDPLLSPQRPYPGLVADWREWLQGPEQPGVTERLRRSTKTGRPCGDASFVAILEQKLGRILRPLKRGPKAKPKGEEETGQMDLFDLKG